MKITKTKLLAFFISGFFLFGLAEVSEAAENKFLQTFACLVGANYSPGDEVNLAKFDITLTRRTQYNDIDGDTWGAVKAINPDAKIFLYQASRVGDNQDGVSLVSLRSISRWLISRGHSMGSLYGNNPELLLYNAKDELIFTPPFPFSKVGDFGSALFQKYWLEATINDIVNQPWKADGVFIDVVPFRPVQLSSTSVKYNTDQKWATAQHSFINKMATGLGAQNQKIITNTRLANQVDVDNYIISDNSAAPPYGMLNEGAFAVPYGSGDVQFFVESYWKRQIDLMSQVDNINTLYLSHSELSEGDSGTDNWGKPVIFRDILWYAMGSYHIGKNTISNNNYWSLTRSYGRALWFDEYDHIDLGDAIGKYKVTNIGGNNIYYREFEKGYVYVNPTTNNVSNIALPETCKQLTYTNFKNNPSTISDTNTINLVSHRGTFLLKSDGGDISDTADPVVISFTSNKTTVNTNDSITFNWKVKDDDKDLKQVELFRKIDGGAWLSVPSKIQLVSGENASGIFTDVPTIAGTYWYGLHVVDQSGNVGVEPSPIRVVVSGGVAAENKFLQTFAVKYGTFTPEQLAISAKYDMLDCNRFAHDDIGGDTWAALKAINPDVEIFLYQASRVQDDDDTKNIKFLNNLGRWNVSRDHSMGSLNINNPNLFLLDSGGNRIFTPVWMSYLLDVGSNDFINYWNEATIHDMVGQPWEPDGVFIDVVGFRRLSMNAAPVKYNSDAKWSVAMQKFLNGLTAELNKKNLKLWGNTEYLKTEFDVQAYIEIDNSANPPYALMNEGAFAVEWGPSEVQFYPENLWKLQVDLLSKVHNSKITYLSHSNVSQGNSGIDNWGKPATFSDILWYALGSFHIGKNTVSDNSYFGYSKGYSNAQWFDEYDHIDLGNAIGKYKVANISGNNIYYREFEKGYVYVNPTTNNVSNIALPETCKQLTYTNFKNNPSTISDTNTINLVSHRGTFLLKSDGGSSLPTCASQSGDCCDPLQFCQGGSSVGSSDCPNVCCVGGTCKDVAPATTCQSEGYQCCAICYTKAYPEYNGNCSGQKCCAVCSVSTIVDLIAPTVPANLEATGFMITPKIGLKWIFSTDNIGVAGYRIYRDGVEIATTGRTYYEDHDISFNITYTYTVSAYDAAGNESAQSNSASAMSVPLGVEFKKGVSVSNLTELVGNLLTWVLSIAGSLALLVIIFGGVMYMGSIGDEQKIIKAKKIVYWAVGGLLLILVAYSAALVLEKILN